MGERPACPETKECTCLVYLKVCLTCLREIIGGKQMNGQVGMRAFPMLLAVLLVSMVVVPAVAMDATHE